MMDSCGDRTLGILTISMPVSCDIVISQYHSVSYDNFFNYSLLKTTLSYDIAL